uniref:Uncharacterized protein n=1 Tax=Seriola lalandi dorsalis TaxID=1841481 RepID=A0A3B4WH58_SERLL
LLQHDIDVGHTEILGYRNHQTCMKEAALLDCYVCCFWWTKEAKFTPKQVAFTIAVLHMLLENIRVQNVLYVFMLCATHSWPYPPLRSILRAQVYTRSLTFSLHVYMWISLLVSLITSDPDVRRLKSFIWFKYRAENHQGVKSVCGLKLDKSQC